jgi:hypothetical protein
MVWRLASCLLVAVMVLVVATAASAQTRPLAPGVLTVIPPDSQYEETYSGPMALVEIAKGLPELDWQPNFEAKSRTAFERSRLAVLRRQVWNLEFAFKPMRTIVVDVPQPTAKMQKKVIWYIVYRVRYLGNDMIPEAAKDAWGHELFDSKPVTQEGWPFFPQFVLASHDFSKSYQDRIIPAAKKLIEEREMRDQKLLNTVEISRQPIPLSTADNPQEVWGLATWEDIDPRLTYFSVYIKGLTNAYKPVDLPDAFKAGDPPGTGRDILSKTLQLNFWRPGDTINEVEDEVRYGVPYDADAQRQKTILDAFGLQERVDYLWVYR